jgi:hypothetical protein
MFILFYSHRRFVIFSELLATPTDDGFEFLYNIGTGKGKTRARWMETKHRVGEGEKC